MVPMKIKKILLLLAFGFVFVALGIKTLQIFNPQGGVEGMWKNSAGEYVFLAQDGKLSFPNNGLRQGQNWLIVDNDKLVFDFIEYPQKGVQKKYTATEFDGEKLVLVDAENVESVWQRQNIVANTVQGILMYRERMALPPRIELEIELFTPTSDKPFARLLREQSGQAPLAFSLDYIAGAEFKNMFLRASIYVGDEKIFMSEDVELTAHTNHLDMSVLLIRQMPKELENTEIKDIPVYNPTAASVSSENSEESENLEASESSKNLEDSDNVSLKNTYWKLVELNGTPVLNFAEQGDLYFIINKDEVNGSDGCNNFFSSFELEGQNLKILPGGVSMKMCHEGVEQSREYMQALFAANSWQRNGDSLELKQNDTTIAVFKAVYF